MFRFLSLLLLVVLAVPAYGADSILDRIARTGVLVAGTREDAPPFAFRDPQGHLVGFSVDVIEEIRKAVAAKFGRDVRTDTVIVSTMTRLSVVQEHRADIVCETATVTWPRQQSVDFTLPIFRDGTRILAYRETANRSQDLHDLRVGVVDGSVTGEILKDRMPDIALSSFATMPAALGALESGKVDGIANTGLVLRGLLAQAGRRQGLVIVPRGEALGYEALACIVPKDDPAWRDFVNGVLRELFRGIADYRGRYVRIYDRWFGRDADITYPLDERTVQFFLSALVWLD